MCAAAHLPVNEVVPVLDHRAIAADDLRLTAEGINQPKFSNSLLHAGEVSQAVVPGMGYLRPSATWPTVESRRRLQCHRTASPSPSRRSATP
eukprot:COSAG03_NODE_5321_length_1275_cov_638.112245_1_plen_91_part_01